MSDDIAAWEAENERYLSAALAWLRLRLERLSARPVAAPAPAHAEAPLTELFDGQGEPSVWERIRGRRKDDGPGAVAVPRVPLLASSTGSLDQRVDEAEAELAPFEAVDPPPALLLLQRRFGLTRFERDVLLLAVAMELDTRVPSLCAQAHDDPGRPWPSFALAMVLFDDPAWEAVSPEGPLRRWRLVEVAHAPPQPLTASPLRADERIVNFAKGLNQLDARVAALVQPLAVEPGASLASSQADAAERALRAVATAGDAPPPLLHLAGGDPDGKALLARHVCDVLGLACHRLLPDALPPGADVEAAARLWQRETALLPLALYVEAPDDGVADSAPVRFAARTRGVCFLDARDLRLPAEVRSLTLEVKRPTPAEQRAAWASLLGEGAGDAPARLAGQFDLSLPVLARVAREALAGPGGGVEAVWAGCLAATRPGLDRLAVRIEPRAGWDDLVLPEAEAALLRQLAAQVAQRTRVYQEWGFARKMSRGLGISALFAGESGTGKTMAAEVLAAGLRLNLYRIDLSAVVSKYIGETEKNLRRLFDAADDGGAILFFDEADAIFGKRSEVKDSHDRYANIEINYLLQRMEAYRGLAVLATNMKDALDTAFLRRLRFIVEFPFPGPAERRRIWARVFPPETATEALDLDRLARLNLTGGSIHNVALNAAFQAADAGTSVGMPQILAAARAEFRKLGRPVNEAEFAWRQPALGAA